MRVGHLPLSCTLFSKIHFFNNRSFTSSKFPVHTVVQSCTRTHWNNYMYQYFRGFWSPIWRRTSNTQGAYTVWEEYNLSKITLKVAKERLTFRWKYLHSLCPVQLLRELADLIESNSSTKKKILADGCSKE